MNAKPPKRAGITGLWMAQRRAEETKRTDRLFADPLAAEFVAASGASAPPSWAGLGAPRDYFAVRTRFFDDWMLAAAVAGCHQVVLLAAGLDARAFRLAWPAGVVVFEIDLPEVLDFKDKVLATRRAEPTCERVALRADLRGDWPSALRAAGFDLNRASAWLAEGILMYLTPSQGDALVANVSDLATTGSRLALEHVRRSLEKTLAVRAGLLMLSRLGARWQSGIDEPASWLAGFGWRAEVHDPAGLARSYGRRLAGPAQGWLIDAVRTGP